MDWLLSLLGKQRKVAIGHYKQFVESGNNQPSPWKSSRNQIYLGDGAFIEKMQAELNSKSGADLSEIPRAQKRSIAKPLTSYFNNNQERNRGIVEAYASGAYSMKEIGNFVGLHYSRVSRIIQLAKDKT